MFFGFLFFVVVLVVWGVCHVVALMATVGTRNKLRKTERLKDLGVKAKLSKIDAEKQDISTKHENENRGRFRPANHKYNKFPIHSNYHRCTPRG